MVLSLGVLHSEESPSVDILQVQSQIEAIQGQMRAIEQQVSIDPEVVAASKAFKKAESEFIAFEKGHLELHETHETSKKQLKELDALIDRKLEAHAAYPDIDARLRADKDLQAVLRFEVAKAELELTHPDSPIGRALGMDEDLKLLRDAPKGEEVKKRAEINGFFLLSHSEAYVLKRDVMPEAQKLQKFIADGRRRLAELEQAGREVITARVTLRESIRKGDDPEVNAARKRYLTTRGETNRLMGTGEIRQLGKLRSDTHRILDEKRTALLDGNVQYKALQEQQQKLRAQFKSIGKKAAGGGASPNPSP